MSLYNGPPRGGTRGGKDQFNWENVKADKDREYYLGHSVKATTGRWQKGKDVFWYTREKQDGGAAAQAELLAVKQREEELMAEALGIKPKTVRAPKQPSLDQKDMAQLMQKEEEEEAGGDREAERIKGLGYSVNAVRGAGDAEHEVLPGTVPASGPVPGGSNGALPPPPALSAEDAKRMRKAQEKAAKEARRAEKKEKRKAKKVLKRAKKEAKRAKLEEEQQPVATAQPDGSSLESERSDTSNSDAGAAAQEPRPSSGTDAAATHPPDSPARGRGKRQRHSSPSPDRHPARHDRDAREGDRRRDGPSSRDRGMDSPGRRERRRSKSPAGRRR